MSIKNKTEKEFKIVGLTANYLLAASGGLDSTVLFHLMKDLNLNFSVAHAQFGLRGKESETDEEFVRSLCEINSIPYFTQRLNVPKHMDKHKISLQMSARTLRYDWFNTILEENNIDYIVTAHHLNDSIETFFINLMRGTGLKGLTGIDHTAKIIRPIQNISTTEIKAYAKQEGISWREDATNAADDYVRNKIRHHVVPAIEDIESNFSEHFHHTISLLRKDVALIDNKIEDLRSTLFKPEKYGYKISIESLKRLKNNNTIYYLFEPFGFQHPEEIEKLMEGHESAEIQSEKYRIIKDRAFLLLCEKEGIKPTKIEIHELNEIHEPIHLRFKKNLTQQGDISSFLDFEKIKFPISLRIRENGDRFYPSGMQGKSKKVSKYFKDIKLSKLEKENTWILCNADDAIIGIPGIRWDERFIATKETNIWLLIEKLD